MTHADERWERLINRRLDREIAAEDALDLDKAMLRDPTLREQAQDDVRRDAIVKQALRAALDGPVAAPVLPAERASVGLLLDGQHCRVARRRWLVLALSAAACAMFAAAAWLYSLPAQPGAGERVTDLTNSGATTAAAAASFAGVGAPEADPIGLPRVENRAIDRDVLGVVGDDGNTVYLIEVSRVRTQVAPEGATY